jgi:hypothetical protein
LLADSLIVPTRICSSINGTAIVFHRVPGLFIEPRDRRFQIARGARQAATIRNALADVSGWYRFAAVSSLEWGFLTDRQQVLVGTHPLGAVRYPACQMILAKPVPRTMWRF